MGTCVEIAIDDSGAVTVGLCDEPSGDSDSMQPAQNVQQALQMAKHLLTQPAQQDGSGASGTPDGTGGGTGPDAGGSVVQSPTQDDTASAQGDPKAIWDALAQINMPQN